MTTKAVIFVNLGSPKYPTFWGIAKYLGDFLSDPKVIQFPRLLWLVILYLVVIPLRTLKIISKYQAIWLKIKSENKITKYLAFGSPLHIYSEKFLQKIRAKKLENYHHIEISMRYGEPTIEKSINNLIAKNCNEILVFPLYPQYSIATTCSVIDEFEKTFELLHRKTPKIKWQFIKSYFQADFYINSLVEKINTYWQQNGRGEKLILSFHSLPQKMIDIGDPYQDHCFQTARLLQNQLTVKSDEIIVAFQSRFSKGKWIGPSTIEVLKNLSKNGINNIDIICPGFSVDCLETLDEINIKLRNVFLANGGEKFNYIDCLNEQDYWINNLVEFLSQNHIEN